MVVKGIFGMCHTSIKRAADTALMGKTHGHSLLFARIYDE